jgi:hypothetical protein
MCQGGQADAAVPQLESSTLALQSILEENDDELFHASIPLYPTSSARAVWKAWIFRESVRRTYLTSFLLLAAWHVLNGTPTYCQRHIPPSPWTWTLSNHLWSASSVIEFAVALKEKKRFVVRDLNFSDVLANAVPADFDIMSKIVLVGKTGLDDAQAWFYINGGQL